MASCLRVGVQRRKLGCSALTCQLQPQNPETQRLGLSARPGGRCHCGCRSRSHLPDSTGAELDPIVDLHYSCFFYCWNGSLLRYLSPFAVHHQAWLWILLLQMPSLLLWYLRKSSRPRPLLQPPPAQCPLLLLAVVCIFGNFIGLLHYALAPRHLT